ncbi:MAG: hypothetical protein DMG65_12325 [Candidatus Angelobacter sp. Gp1-AA117]|nr:MAG: hypothetical protein DMG65_12325 [Candidatus Angelobacter sp. Gp1-AA117]
MTSVVTRQVTGHDFSRADSGSKATGALAPAAYGFRGRRSLPDTWAKTFIPLIGAAPGKNFGPREMRVVIMYLGTTIDELIKSVERAEKHAREEQTKTLDFPIYQQNNWRQTVEVA